MVKVEGDCNACSEGITIFVDAVARRRLKANPSGCDCVGPDESDLLFALDLASRNIDSVSSFTGVSVLTVQEGCLEAQVNKLEGLLFFDFAGGTLSQSEVELAETSFLQVYNGIAGLASGKYCDPLARTLTSIEFPGSGRRALSDQEQQDHRRLFGTLPSFSGFCIGCESNPPLGNEVIGRRRELLADEVQITETEKTLACLCQGGAIPDMAPLSEVIEDFEEISGLVVNDVFPVIEVECPIKKVAYGVKVDVDLTITDVLDADTEAAIGTCFADSYSRLAQEFFCDPKFRFVQGATVDAPTETGLTLDVQVICRGCSPGTSLFESSPSRRELGQAQQATTSTIQEVGSVAADYGAADDTSFLRMLPKRSTTEICYCPGDAPQRGPSQAKMQELFNTCINDLGSSAVSAP